MESPKLQLRVKLMILFSLAALLPFALTGLLTFVRFQSALRTDAERQGNQLTATAASQISSFIVSQMTVLDTLATLYNPEFPTDPKITDQVVEHTLFKSDNFIDISIVDKNGDQIVKQDRLVVILPENLKNVSNTKAFLNVKKNGLYISSLYIDRGKPFFDIGRAVTDSQGVFLGAVFAQVDAKVLPVITGDISKIAGQNGRVYVVNEFGTVIAYPDLGYILEQKDLSALPPINAIINDRRATGILDSYKNENGIDVLGAALPLNVSVQGSKELNVNWFVVAEQSSNVVFAEAYRVALFAFLMMMIVMALAILGAIYFARRISKPVEALNIATIELQQAKAKDDIILESIGDALIITDEWGKILLINRSAQQLLGCKLEDHNIVTFADCILSIADEKGVPMLPEKQPIKMALATGRKLSANAILTKKDDSQFLANITAAPYIFDQRIAGTACIIRDVTKEKEIDRAKSEFVSLASHQLRTPLSTIGWYTEMLLAGDAGQVNSEQKRYLNEIYQGNTRMVELVNALLNVSRIELGTFVLVPEPVNLQEISQSVIKELAPKIIEKELVVKENYVKGLAPIPADAKLTRIIFQNLISNAVKYTAAEGKVTVSISLKTGAQLKKGKPRETYVLISVADTGYGIPKNQFNKIFTKLFRADNVREKETDGTGLGLYLVKSVLEACGGEVWFESEENKGTTFFAIIPQKGMKAVKGQKSLT